jgi:hypothetical protein
MTNTAQFPQNGNNTIKDGEVILIKSSSATLTLVAKPLFLMK